MGLPRISTPDSPVSPRCRVTLDSLKLWMFGWNGQMLWRNVEQEMQDVKQVF